MIIIENRAKESMLEDAIGAFPDECCGFMFGEEDTEGNRVVKEIMAVKNAKEGDKRRRFEIAPADYLKAEQHAAMHNILLLGVYHSHPNHPAIPSEHDRKAAQPYFSYVIISIMSKIFSHLRSWRLNDEIQFDEESITDYQFN